MQQALGSAWDQLPPALQSHYLVGPSGDVGCMDIEFPRFMQPVLWAVSLLGALVHRRGRSVPTSVAKKMEGGRLHWRRTLRYAGGMALRFDSTWELGADGLISEFVNPWLGLQMRPGVTEGQLRYEGVRFIIRLGRWTLPLPEWLLLGHTTIEECALDERHFSMDFRMTHPLFGQVYRYSGIFRADVGEVLSAAPSEVTASGA